MANWTEESINYAEGLLGAVTYEQIAASLRDKFGGEWSSEQVRGYFKYRRLRGFDDADLYQWKGIREQLDTIYRPYSPTRVFVASDFEFPYIDHEFFEKAKDDIHSSKCDHIILGGDILHQNQFSKFKSSNRQPFKLEFSMAVDMLGELTDGIDTTVIYGNHDIRLANMITKETDFHEYAFLLGNSTIDPLQILCNELGLAYARNWWVQVGPVIVAHPGRYSNVTLKNITNSIDYFYPRIDKPWQVLCQGHSHQLNTGTYKNKYYHETGCMCETIDYKLDLSQTTPIWVQGYSILEIEDGVYNHNNSRQVSGRTLL